MKSLPLLFALLLFTMMAGPSLSAAPNDQSSTVPSGQSGASTFQYKMISGFKQPFNDDMQLHFSKGWIPAGGVSVTTWSNDLFFAVLLKKISTE